MVMGLPGFRSVLLKGGPLPVINEVITSISRVTTPSYPFIFGHL